jgi:hypothetical protein
VRITKIPRAELEQYAREQYARQFGQQAPIKVRNAQALVALGEHRALKWRGHAYRVPPLSWKAGARLLVISQALATGEGGERAVRLARAVVHGLVQRRRFVARRDQYGRLKNIVRDWAKPRRNPFRAASPVELRQVADYLIDVPDENRPPPGKATSVDLMHGVLDVAERWPAFINDEGLPKSWELYQWALRSLGRVRARDELQAAQANRMGPAPKDKWHAYSHELESVAGVN